ncbi:MAG: DJ-1/PfpI family protein [Deltaproteobacteria bacterium]|nr:DJ-1/PfpI family protein [Deltaproteobacteria bacterium]
MNKRVLVPFSAGFEEIETVTIVDVLRRASIDVTLAALHGERVTGRSGITVKADKTLDEALVENSTYDMIVLPGGQPNAYALRDDARIIDEIKNIEKNGGYTAAICAAPAALEKAGLLGGKEATNYPSLKKDLVSCIYSEKSVVESGRVITSRGPGTAMEFALKLVALLKGDSISDKVAADLVTDKIQG